MAKDPSALDVHAWYTVTFDAASVCTKVTPPGREAWSDSFRWADVMRVCFGLEDLFTSDGIYVFTKTRPQSYVIPAEASGGAEFVNELLRRKLFDPELLIKASSSTAGLFCWPGPDKDRTD